MQPGEKCICQYENWCCAFGEGVPVSIGQRLTVAGSTRVGGVRFLSFEEMPDHCFYMETGFKPLRNLN